MWNPLTRNKSIILGDSLTVLSSSSEDLESEYDPHQWEGEPTLLYVKDSSTPEESEPSLSPRSVLSYLKLPGIHDLSARSLTLTSTVSARSLIAQVSFRTLPSQESVRSILTLVSELSARNVRSEPGESDVPASPAAPMTRETTLTTFCRQGNYCRIEPSVNVEFRTVSDFYTLTPRVLLKTVRQRKKKKRTKKGTAAFRKTFLLFRHHVTSSFGNNK